jgi:hypothetical protein
MPLIDLRGPTAAFAENKPPHLRRTRHPGFCPEAGEAVTRTCASCLPNGARALVDPELTQHTPLISAPDRGWIEALVGVRGLRLRVFSHFRPCLASPAAHGTKTRREGGRFGELAAIIAAPPTPAS